MKQLIKTTTHFGYALFLLSLMTCKDSKNSAPVAEGQWIKGSPKEQLKIIESQFRGFDMTMVEIGYRYQELYWGAEDAHWEYAAYQLKKIKQALTYGIQRRPNRAETAAPFINAVIPEVKKAIDAKDKVLFDKAFNTMRINCNACHMAQGGDTYPTFTVQMPRERPSPIQKR